METRPYKTDEIAETSQACQVSVLSYSDLSDWGPMLSNDTSGDIVICSLNITNNVCMRTLLLDMVSRILLYNCIEPDPNCFVFQTNTWCEVGEDDILFQPDHGQLTTYEPQNSVKEREDHRSCGSM